MDFVFENSRGEVLNLWHNQWFYLIDQAGQTQGDANISALVVGDMDGDIPTNVNTQPRTIVLNLRINPAVNVEDAKRAITKVVKLKQTGTIIWTQNDETKKISGIIESISMPRWNHAVVMQIQMHCSDPYWKDAQETIQQINEAIGLHYFTAENDTSSYMLYFPEDGRPLGEYDTTRSRTFTNNGDVAVGMDIEILALDTVTNPIIYDQDGDFIGVGYGTKPVVLSAGDVIRICTKRGQLSVVKNQNTNMLNYVKPRSNLRMQIQTGENTFRIDSDDASTQNMVFSLTFTQGYI